MMGGGSVNIGEAAHASGMSPKKIRYYEAIGLMPTPSRRSSGYRQYELADVHRLRLIRTARDVGLSFHDIRELLALWADRKRGTGEIKLIALAKIAELQKRLRNAAAMIDTLHELATGGKHQGEKGPSLAAAKAPSRTRKAARKRNS
jgi:MerR family transcriptional regulator, copper efflux regulator